MTTRALIGRENLSVNVLKLTQTVFTFHHSQQQELWDTVTYYLDVISKILTTVARCVRATMNIGNMLIIFIESTSWPKEL